MMGLHSGLCNAACQHVMSVPIMSPGTRFSANFFCVVIFVTCEKIRMLCLVAVGLNIKMRCTHAVS